MIISVHRKSICIEDVETGAHRNRARSQSPAMALGRVLLSLVLWLGLYNADALSLDLEGLKDQAVAQITGPKLMDIVRTLPAMLAWKAHESLYLHWNPRTYGV